MSEDTLEQRRVNAELRRVFRWYDAARIGKVTVKDAILELRRMEKEFITSKEAKEAYAEVLIKLNDPNFEVKKRK